MPDRGVTGSVVKAALDDNVISVRAFTKKRRRMESALLADRQESSRRIARSALGTDATRASI